MVMAMAASPSAVPPSASRRPPLIACGFSRTASPWSSVQAAMLTRPLPTPANEAGHASITSIVLAPLQVLRNIPAIAGTYVEMSSSSGASALAQIVLLQDEQEQHLQNVIGSHLPEGQSIDGFVFLPPCLMFHLFGHRHGWDEVSDMKIRRFAKWSRPPSSPSDSMAESMRLPVPTATEARLVRILCPSSPSYTVSPSDKNATESASAPPLEAVREFFKQPHVLTDGMLVGIPTNMCHPCLDRSLRTPLPVAEDHSVDAILPYAFEEDALATVSCGTVPAHAIPLAFYRVYTDSPSTSPYFTIDANCTRVIEQGSAQSRVPYAMEEFLCTVPSREMTLSAPEESLLHWMQPLLGTGQLRRILRGTVLIRGRRRSGKRMLVARTSRKLGLHLLEVNMFELLQPTERQTSTRLRSVFDAALQTSDIVLHLRRLSAFTAHALAQGRNGGCDLLASSLKDELERLHRLMLERNLVVIVVGSADDDASLSSPLRACFAHEMRVGSLDEAQRQTALEHLCLQHNVYCEDSSTVQQLARQTAAFGLGNFRELIVDAIVAANRRSAVAVRDEVEDDMYGGGTVADGSSQPTAASTWTAAADWKNAVSSTSDRMASSSASAGTNASIPDVRWSDIGGVEDVRKVILDVVELPLRQPHLFAKGLKRRSGVLLYGPPGTGKTLVAKAVATECSLNFISVKGPELLNMYVGESEANVRRVFQRARDAAPCVLFFDELDSLAPNRGQGSDSGGVMDRVVSQLLTELDGMNKSASVFVIGATNRPDLVDSAILRPGRLDRCVYMGVSDTKEKQLDIVKALTRKYPLAADVDLQQVVDKCTMQFSGADLYALCSDAMLNALSNRVQEIEECVKALNSERSQSLGIRQYLDGLSREQLQVQVAQRDFITALSQLTPSLSMDELQRYLRLRQDFEKSVRT